MRKATGVLPAILLASTTAGANEVTVKNDSIVNFSNAVVEAGFAASERAGVWLTSPCAGNIVAAQIFWLTRRGKALQA